MVVLVGNPALQALLLITEEEEEEVHGVLLVALEEMVVEEVGGAERTETELKAVEEAGSAREARAHTRKLRGGSYRARADCAGNNRAALHRFPIELDVV